MMFRRKRETKRVTLYGKPGCHLCEDARSLLDGWQSRYPMEITEVDITSDPQLFRRYDIVIPVIVIDNAIELQAPIDAANLRRALARR